MFRVIEGRERECVKKEREERERELKRARVFRVKEGREKECE